MILSMTGFGQASGNLGEKNFLLEIRSVNGRTTDLRMKTPAYYKEKELILRKMIMDRCVRGKLDAILHVKSEEGDTEYAINRGAFKKYYKELSALTREVGAIQGDILQSIMRIPNIVVNNDTELSDEEWEFVQRLADDAIINLDEFRKEEGAAMEKDLRKSAEQIAVLLDQVGTWEDERTVTIRERLARNLEEFLGKDNVDKNRYEQEVIYYIEKLDINEEKVRLAQHCKYFLEILDDDSLDSKGRVLGFVGQEMGREINTLGAKAQHSDIQKVVVQMKDELEQIKEQVANIV